MKKKSLLLSLIAVLVIGLIVAGSTFAYFQWTTADDQRTNVSVQIEHGSIVMTISPEKTEFSGLRPTSDCSARAAYGDALVKVENGTGTVAIPSFKLKVRVDKNGTGELTKAALSHINYVVIPLETVVDSNGIPVKGEPMTDYVAENQYSCRFTSQALLTEPSDDLLFHNSDAWWDVHLYFDNVSTTGEWSHIPNCGDTMGARINSLNGSDCGYLPRQYLLDASNYGSPFVDNYAYGITFPAGPGGTTYQYYRVYVWIDEGYTATAVGNVVSDPLQNATIYVTWSEESTIQQVEGVFTPGDNYVAGSGAPVAYELSGIWQFNDVLTLPDVDGYHDNIGDYINFNSGGSRWYGMSPYSGGIWYYYANPQTELPTDVYYYWGDGEEYKTVDFGDTPQEVNKELYEWFTANATKQ